MVGCGGLTRVERRGGGSDDDRTPFGRPVTSTRLLRGAASTEAATARNTEAAAAEEEGVATALLLPGWAEAAADPVTTFRDVV